MNYIILSVGVWMVLVVKISGFSINDLLLNHNENYHGVAQCVLKLTAKYFVDKIALSGSIVIININSYMSNTQKTILEAIHSGYKYTVMVKDSAFPHKNASHFPEKAKNYMLILENENELLRNILQLNKLPTWNPHAQAVIYIEYRDGDLDSLIKDLINCLQRYRVLNTIVLVNFPDENKIVAYTWKPYSETNCGGICNSFYILDICIDKKLHEIRSAKPMIPINMNRCPLTVYTVVSAPYVMPPKRKMTNSNYDDEYEFKFGIEINILKIITRLTNMSLIIRMINTTGDWGSIDSDGTATGLFAKLKSEEVDLIVGNMEGNKIIRKFFDPSKTYMQDEITWCVPIAGTDSTWANIVTIFDFYTWILTLALILIVSLLFHCMKCVEKPNMTKWPTKSILMTLGMILGWGALFKPKKIAFRILLFSWLIFSINLNTSYQSLLRSFLIHPKYQKQINTELEIVRAKYCVGGRAPLKDYFTGDDFVSKYIYKHFQSCSNFNRCIKKVGIDKNFTLIGSRRQAYYQDQYIGKGKTLIYCFPEENALYKYGVVILARKWFPMMSKFNGIIRSVFENGLIWKWNSEVFLHQNKQDSNDMVPLGMDHMFGAFMFLMIGYIACFTVCLLEVIVFKIHVFMDEKWYNNCFSEPEGYKGNFII